VKKPHNLIFLTIACILILISCSKNSTEEGETPVLKSPDIFVAGYTYNDPTHTATLWKNGVAIKLTNGLVDAKANSVFVSDSDVYVAGNDLTACYWKNGNEVQLTDGSVANSIFISGNDIYVVGVSTYHQALMWKNGIKTELAPQKLVSSANSVFVTKTGDVFVAGFVDYPSGNNNGNIATLWKNGEAINLISSGTNAEAYSVYVSDGNTYVVGSESDKDWNSNALYWKNGKPVALEGATNAEACSVYVSDSDVYVVGTLSTGLFTDVARIWKNGVPTNYSGNSCLNSVYVYDKNIYMTGCQYNNSGDLFAKIWKNGIMTDFTVNNAAGLSIFVK